MQVFSWWGVLSGGLFVASSASAITAISLIGLSAASGVWCGTAVLVSFSFGVLVAGDHVERLGLAAAALALIVCGIAGIAVAAWAGLGLAFNTRLSAMMASALAPTGALFTFLSLATGSLWGKPMWGTWWVWDARLTSELILLFLYLGFLALQSSIDDPRRADKACAVLALVGVVNVPIIYFSVVWWNTLHQGASVSLTSAPSMAAPMLAGMLVMVLAFWMYAIAAALARVRSIILDRERHTEWVKHAVE